MSINFRHGVYADCRICPVELIAEKSDIVYQLQKPSTRRQP